MATDPPRSPVFEVWLDEKQQIIRQRVHCEPDLDQYLCMIEESRACASRLRRPDDVRVLVDGSWLGRMRRPVREQSIVDLRRPELKRLAIIVPGRVARVFARFIAVASGLDKMRSFPSEAEALEWLVS
jgi:hypothetical protein